MLEIVRPDRKWNFTGQFAMTAVFSIILVIASLFLIQSKLQYGVDFRGGAEIQVKFNQPVPLDKLRSTLKNDGFPSVIVQTIGEKSENEVLLKVAAGGGNLNDVAQSLKASLEKNYQDFGANVRKVDIVGPKAGAALRISGFQAMAWAMLSIMVYIALRFDMKYSPGAVVALIHDVSIILGIFAITGTEFTLNTVAALLAVIGYSVNDTVIVYDRVREHEEKYPDRTLKEHINNAISETLSRTILTSGTTLFISLSMFVFGGVAIKGFFMAMSLGVIIGTYSSIYIAAPVTLFFDRIKSKREQKVVSA
jgi:preprotein translocase subunit SecF